MTFATMLPAVLFGFGTSLALIVAIGAQNAYVLRVGLQAVTRVGVPVVVVCAVSDAVLISAGVAGVGALVEAAPQAVVVVQLVGAGFLLVYGAFAAKRAIRPVGALTVDVTPESARVGVTAGGAVPADGAPPVAQGPRPPAAGRADSPARVVPAVLGALAFTWLNPHTYLDTIVFLGSVANHQPPELRWWFAAGAITGSLVWFSALGFGARLLRPLFAKPVAWRVLDAVIAVVMVALGLRLLFGL
ncbi:MULTISPECIES: LysE/ArgO family amino acid transporter [unclassified Frigoribacterium]|uniref:LysE/ArgO family amino acid transporter n=1 Tax=unclassified Frigoribacterium TaxID=2627005 RepID=UPI0006F7BA33|nr:MULTISPECIES: LysE family transporter [unclassified Frigoribacterium]KQO47709.1 amino acid transporter [Frigoribacterium sp. Leaf254]KQT39802.1 amino acid transporter [Frigoribacterium sp. Leaf415]